MRSAGASIALGAASVFFLACGKPAGGPGDLPDAGQPDSRQDGGSVDDGNDSGVDEGDGCPALFDQDRLPVWSVTLSDQEWAALNEEFLNREERDDAGLDVNPYHPVERITYDDGRGPIEVANVLIRLKGKSSWVQTVELDPNPKMQLVIAFNEIDEDGRFFGVRKVELDMPRSDHTFIRQRLGLHILREIGQDAQCANNARLYINGEYYGLYSHLERLDKEFIQRVYGKDNGVDEGDLWKSGSQIRTNEDSYSDDRLDALWAARSAAEIDALADLESSIYAWAAEAMIPHADGYHIGRYNFFLYDHPERGFVWLPFDLDTGFDYYRHDLDVAFPPCSRRDYDYWIPYATTLSDPAWMERYVDAVAEARSRIDPADHVELVDTWSAQIAGAAAEDPHRPFDMDDHQWALDLLREHLHLRARFIDDWIACRGGGGGADNDGDGVIFCFDCDDYRASISPDKTEVCNGVDDDCDGFLDEGC